MTGYVMQALLEKRRGIDTCMIGQICFSSALKGRNIIARGETLDIMKVRKSRRNEMPGKIISAMQRRNEIMSSSFSDTHAIGFAR